MKKTVFFCIGLTISASLFAATGSNTKKTSKAKTTATKTASTKKSETKKSTSTSKNANAKKDTKDKKNTENKKNTGSKTESKKGTVNSKNSKSNTTKNTRNTKATKTATTRSSKTETTRAKKTATVGRTAAAKVEKETVNQESVMVTNLNTIYENKDKDIKIRNNDVAETFEKEIEERAQYTHFQTGMASFYGGKWHGKKTANGEIFNENSLTAAHKTLPFGTRVKVTNLDNGKSVVVRINNRGPYSKGRVIDLSKAAFAKIANTSKGVTKVKLEIAK